MDPNPYSPPSARVEDTPEPQQRLPAFFPVSQTKLLVMSICTFGLYELYWFYKNWKLVQVRTGERMLPALRAIFAILFCYQLFDKIRKTASGPPAASLAAGPLAAAWIVLTITWRLPDPYGLLTFLAPLALLPVQAAANAVNLEVAPQHDPNAHFSAWNWVGVAIGGLLCVLAVIGSFMPGP